MSSKNNTLQGAKNKNIFPNNNFSMARPKTVGRLNKKNNEDNTGIYNNNIVLKNSSRIHLNKENVRVIVRIRPFDLSGNLESLQGCVKVIHEDSGKKKIVLEDPRHRALPKSYEFDEVYDTDSKTEYIYSEEVKDFISPLLSECTCINIFAFGSSGTGKTYTMHGGGGDDVGIVGLTIKQLIEINDNQEVPGKFSFSFFEVYCEKIQDLLSGIDGVRNSSDPTESCSSKVSIRTDICGRVRVVGTIKSEFTTWDDFCRVYLQALRRRTSGKTSINSASSRSHACIQVNYIPPISDLNNDETNSSVEDTIENRRRRGSISFHVKPKINPNYPRTIVNLIDLSGFENNRVTNNSGRRMIESTFINSSLLSLSKVINALKRNGGTQSSQSCIPYRESKLTRLLQEYLGGGADPPYSPFCLRCIMICTISPSITFFQQTYATLNTPTHGNTTGMMKYIGIIDQKIKEKETALGERFGSSRTNYVHNKTGVNTAKTSDLSKVNQRRNAPSSKISQDIGGKVIRRGTGDQVSNIRSYRNVESRVARMIKGEIPFHSKSLKRTTDKVKSLESLRTNLKDGISNSECDENSKDMNANLSSINACKHEVIRTTGRNLEFRDTASHKEDKEIDLISSSLNSFNTFGNCREVKEIKLKEIEAISSNSENISEKCNIESVKSLFGSSEGVLKEQEVNEVQNVVKITEIKLEPEIYQKNCEHSTMKSVNRPVTRSQTKRQ
ncbi:kinesin heavy chain [Cryptosporidium bovis]|uniref:kinesin heavy chain n=1 Tax=Cryptosporidium bovis TaxID=310047 RepID=UPI003519EAEC|nr:kinesin heavy chain [Cryptosporidium bovis]